MRFLKRLIDFAIRVHEEHSREIGAIETKFLIYELLWHFFTFDAHHVESLRHWIKFFEVIILRISFEGTYKSGAKEIVGLTARVKVRVRVRFKVE